MNSSSSEFISSAHTHPQSGMAFPSPKDVIFFSSKNENAVHTIIGYKYPNTNAFFKSIGQAPEPTLISGKVTGLQTKQWNPNNIYRVDNKVFLTGGK